MPAKREIRLDPLLECRQPEVLEWHGAAGGGLAGEIRERLAAPERQRLGKALGCNGRLGAPRVIDQTLKTVEVALAVGDAQQVPRRLPDEPIAELTPEAAEVVLERGERRGRRRVAPDAVDEPLDGDNAVRIEQEDCQHRPPLHPAERENALAVPDLERP
jgi:hypothetical protein